MRSELSTLFFKELSYSKIPKLDTMTYEEANDSFQQGVTFRVLRALGWEVEDAPEAAISTKGLAHQRLSKILGESV